MRRSWKLSSFDTFCLGMNIKGAWLYGESPDFSKMKSALDAIAAMYPHLAGRYDEKEKAVVWDDGDKPELPFDTLDLRQFGISRLSGNARLTWSLVKPYDVKGFKKGTVPAFSATIGYLKDGCVLYVQCAHATMDAHTFYKLIGQWAALYKGGEPSVMIVDQSLVPSDEIYSKEQTAKLARERGWSMIGFKKLIKMLLDLARNNSIRYTTVIDVPQEEISGMKAVSGAGTNAVLSALALKRMAERIPAKNSFKLLFTTDLRGRINGVGDDFFGNLSQPAVLEDEIDVDADIAMIANRLSAGLKDALASSLLQENVQIYQCSAHYGLPYVPFDASDMNCPGNGTIIVNNFLKFRANELDWGSGLPLYSFANELPDMIKFWQPVAGGPVQIIFGGYAAKLMRDSK